MSRIIILLVQLSLLPGILTCIDSFTKVENDILSNGENIHSLTQAFYPANGHPALWVEVRYYINTTNDTVTSTKSSSTILQDDDGVGYLFYWSYSPVLLFANPEFLEGVSFRFITFPPLVANIVLRPFCSSLNESTIHNLLNDITTWLRSYAIKRSSSTSDGIYPIHRGYSLYKPNINVDKIISFGIDTDRHAHMMIAAMGLFVLFCQVFAGVAFCFFYNDLCQLSREYIIQEKYKFKNIFWSIVICLLLGELLSVGFGLEHIISYGFQAIDWTRRIYIAAFILMSVMFFCDVAIALFFAINKRKGDEIIELPNIMKWFRPESKCDTACTQISQFLAILTLLLSSMILSIFICGVVLAFLIHPLRVGLMVVVTASFIIAFILVLANTFEQYDRSAHRRTNPSESNDRREKFKRRSILLTIFWLFILIIPCLLIGLFSAVYLNIILFNDPGVLNQLAQLFPAVIVILVVTKEFENDTLYKLFGIFMQQF